MRYSYALAIASTLYLGGWLLAGPEPNPGAITLLAAALYAICAALWLWERKRA